MWPLLLVGGVVALAAGKARAKAPANGRPPIDPTRPTEIVEVRAAKKRIKAASTVDHRKSAAGSRTTHTARAKGNDGFTAGDAVDYAAKKGVQTYGASWGVPPQVSGKAYEVGKDVLGEVGSWF